MGQNFIYVAVWNGYPILSGYDLEKLFVGVDDHFGANENYKFDYKRISWKQYVSKYGDDFIGTLSYQNQSNVDGELELVKIYTVTFEN